MLKKFGFFPESHLRNKADFDQVFKARQRLFGKHFVLYWRLNSLTIARIGLVTSKRNLPKAVDRNRFRRAAKEAFRLQQLQGFDLVVVAKKHKEKVANQELHRCINSLLNRLIAQSASSSSA